MIALDGGARLGYAAVPAQDEPKTGLYVFDDPSKEGYKARWIVTERVVRGVSSTTGGTTLNGVSVTTQSSGSTRFAGVSQETARLLEQQQALSAELTAASSENVSLRNTLQSSGTTTTTTTKAR